MAAIKYAGSEALRGVMHDQMGFPRDPVQLYQVLEAMRQRFKGFETHRLNKLFPPNGSTDSETMDTNLLVDIITRATKCPKPTKPIIALPDPDDVISQLVIFPPTFPVPPNLADQLKWMKDLRNILAHYGTEKIVEELCNHLWERLKFILNHLKYDTTKLQNFREGKWIMKDQGRTVSAQVVIEYMALHLANIRKKILLEEDLANDFPTVQKLKVLFFELVCELSVYEIKEMETDLIALKKDLFSLESELYSGLCS